jgi:hypothetical protein
MANPERVPAAAPEAPAQQVPVAQQPFVRPDDIPGLATPTERPNEPVTAGMALGPGAGPRPGFDPVDKTGITLRVLYEATGDENIRRLIMAHEEASP